MSAPTDRRGRRNAAAIVIALCLSLTRGAGAAELMINEVTDLAFDVHVASDTIVFSALGQIWRMPLSGGLATAISPPVLLLDRPRISPDGRQVVAEGGDRVGRHSLWLMPASGGSVRELTTAPGRHGGADWHPDGDRLAFSSHRGRDRDLWALRLSDGVEWQLTAAEGDEFDPAWEPDGTGLLFASNGPRGYAVRRLGVDGSTTLITSRDNPVSAPRRRPGGLAVLFVERGGDGVRSLNLLLPVAEQAVKSILSAADLEDERVAWRDRNRLFVARNGRLYERELAGPRTRSIPLTAFVTVAGHTEGVTPAAPAAEASSDAATPPPQAMVLRAPRVFDPAAGRHLAGHDVRIEGGRVAEVVPRRNWRDILVIEFADSTVLPGFIDTALRDGADIDTARLVGGVTAVAVAMGNAGDAQSAGPVPARLPVDFTDVRAIDNHAARASAIRAARDAGLQVIGDRLLPDLRFGVSTLDGIALPADSDVGAPRYADMAGLLRLSGLSIRDAHRAAATPDVDWRKSRVAAALAPGAAAPPAALAPALDVISRHAAGEAAPALLRGITLDAAAAAGRADLGRIGVGAIADFVIVPGDPIVEPAVLLDPIAVVKAGRLHSVSGLLDSVAERRDTLQSAGESAAAVTSGIIK